MGFFQCGQHRVELRKLHSSGSEGEQKKIAALALPIRVKIESSATAAANVGAHSSNRHYQLWITLVGAPVSLDISSSSMSKSGRSISVRAGRLEFHKINTAKFDLRDTYHFILTLTWPKFAALVLAIYVLINLVFAGLYVLGGRCIAELPPGSFSEAFFLASKLWPLSATGTCTRTPSTAIA